MTAAGYDVREADPFAPEQTVSSLRARVSPLAQRIEGLWALMREEAIEAFPVPLGRPENPAAYLSFVDDIYRSDAYHSLSIEGYSVTPELVERVRGGAWDPEAGEGDRKDRDALSARGYWQAFQAVRKSVTSVLEGANPGVVARADHRVWYRELFQPFVTANILAAPALAGYRNDPVYLKGSRHVPPRSEAVREAMPALFDLLQHEHEPAARAVLGHWLVGYIHPYPDGNGRIARFLMNTMLASGGFPWTVIRVEDRDEYLSALESASVEGDIRPFARFTAERVRWSIERSAG
jgi:Fic family protein